MSQFSELFLDTNKPCVKRTFVCSEEDYNLVKNAFPEIGFLAYFPGFVFKTLANELRAVNVKDFDDRMMSDKFRSLTKTLKAFGNALKEENKHE